MSFNPAPTISYLQIGLSDFLLANVAERNLYDLRGQALKDRWDFSRCLQGWCLQALRESSFWEKRLRVCIPEWSGDKLSLVRLNSGSKTDVAAA